jgi:hypothetical protein
MSEAPPQTDAPQSLPIGAVLLLGFAYTNLWITDLIPGYDWVQSTLSRVLLTLATILYLGIVFSTGPNSSPSGLARSRRWRTLLALGLIILMILWPTALFIGDRLSYGPDPRNVIDWPLQIEAGSALLLQGQSPYGADYSTTEMQPWSERANFPSNPALRHAIHLPVNFILGVVILPLWGTVTGWQDARIILIAAYLAVVLIAPRLARRWEDGHALMIGLALNPLLADTFAVGLSDVLLLAWLVLALWSRQRGHHRITAALLGVAVATRQFSWLLIPLYLVAELRAASVEQPPIHAQPNGSASNLGALWRRWSPPLQLWAKRTWPVAVVALTLIVPFALANPQGFYRDVIAFGSGGIEDAYPIGGPSTFGFSALVLALGWAPDQNAQFPFTLVQLGVTIPLMAYAMVAQWRANSLQRLLLGYAIVLAGFLWTGRFMHTNYVGFLFALMLLACFIAPTDQRTTDHRPPEMDNH